MGIRFLYASSFMRELKRLPADLQEEAFDAVDSFRDKKNHHRLKVHKLKGALARHYAFSVNYRIRIIFRYEGSDIIRFLSIGDHDIYHL